MTDKQLVHAVFKEISPCTSELERLISSRFPELMVGVNKAEQAVATGVNIKNIIQEASPSLSLDKVEKIKNEIIEWLGEDAKIIKNKAQDIILLSKDETRRIRFDFKRPKPHKNPHIHIEQLSNNEWETHRIYPKDVPHC